MSEFDTSVKTTLLNILGPVVVLFILFLLLRNPLKSLKQKFFAWFMNRLVSRMNNKLGGEKKALFAPLAVMKKDVGKSGLTLLEVGAGSGANFKFYPRGTNVVCVDPNPHFDSYLKGNLEKFPNVNLKEFVVAKGEDMSEVPDNFCDAAVCTFVLCSVEDIDKVLKELKRVLKPGGVLFYLEHIAYHPSTWTYRLQCMFNPVCGVAAEGCSLTKETWRNLDQAGFSELEYHKFSKSSWMLPLRWLMSGTATK